MAFDRRNFSTYPSSRGALGFATYVTRDNESTIEGSNYFNSIAQEVKDLSGGPNATGGTYSVHCLIMSTAGGGSGIVRILTANSGLTAVTVSDPDVS